MTTKTTAADLLNETHNLVKTIEPLFYNLITTSTHHKLDTIQISTSRAREIQRDLLILKKKLQKIEIPASKEPEHFAHLDNMFQP